MATLRSRLVRAAIVCAVTVVAAQAAHAAPITWWITQASSNPFQPTYISITWEPDTANGLSAYCPPGSGIYPAILGGTLVLEGVSASLGGGGIEVNAPLGACPASTGVEFRTFHLDEDGPLAWLDQAVVFVFPTDTSTHDLYGILSSATHGEVYLREGFFGLPARTFSGPIHSSRPLQPEPIPEPASMILFGTGLLVAATCRRRHRARDRRATRCSLVRTVIATGLTLLTASTAGAAPITWWISGQGYWDWPNDIGASFEFTWEPDTTRALGANCPPGSGIYAANRGAVLSIGGVSAPFGGGAIEVNAPFGNCPNNTGVEFRTFYRGPLAGPLSFIDQAVAFVYPTDTSASDLYGILGGATHGAVFVLARDGRQFTFGGPIGYSRPLEPAPIPEPGSSVLLGIGLLAAASARAWRQRR